MAISIQDIAGCYTFFGLSTDTKPTKNVPNGCCFVEMDTSLGYFWDQENQTWILSI